MISGSLKKYGFRNWYKFTIDKEKDILNILPYDKGVYVIKNKIIFGRFRGKSGILYIGSSIDALNSRIRFYFKPGPSQETSKRINELMKKTKGLKISFIVSTNDKEIRKLEKELRRNYEIDHGELPPWNRSA